MDFAAKYLYIILRAKYVLNPNISIFSSEF